jgi:hypothetical protein
MTLIQQETATYFTLTSPKGKKIGVCFGLADRVSIYIKRNGLNGLAMGRHFASLAEAIAAYKATDVKTALNALVETI